MKTKEFFEKHIASLEARKKELLDGIVSGETLEERQAASETVAAIEAEIADFRAQLSELDKPEGEVKVLEAMTGSAKREVEVEDFEARMAFKNFIAAGHDKDRLAKICKRSDEVTTTGTTNVSTVIPQNLINRIIEKAEQLGVIYNRVTHTSYAVGQEIPVEGIKPTATWVGYNSTTPSSSTSGEGGSSDSQAVSLSAAITFTHFKLRCEIAFSQEVAVMTLSAFEDLFVKKIVQAMLRAKEEAIVSGGGQGMPKGILAETPVTGQALTADVDSTTGAYLTWAKLCEMEGALPVAYEEGAAWCVTKKTWQQIVGMVDDNGQPVARINYGIGGRPERYINGREAIIYEPKEGSLLGSFAAKPSSDTIVAFIFKFEDYTFNENYDLGISEKDDWDNETHKIKAVEGCDGKVTDKNSLVTLTVPAFTETQSSSTT